MGGAEPRWQDSATASMDQTARLWDVATGRLIHTLPHDGEVWVALFSPDGKHRGHGGLRLTRPGSGTPPRGNLVERFSAHEDRIGYAVFSPDGKTLLTGSWDHTARLWDAATGSPLSQPFRHEAQVNSVAFSPDGKIVLTASARSLGPRSGTPGWRRPS